MCYGIVDQAGDPPLRASSESVETVCGRCSDCRNLEREVVGRWLALGIIAMVEIRAMRRSPVCEIDSP